MPHTQVKNRAASRSWRLEQLARRCKRRIMLTGTPLQNDLGELHNLLRFLLPSVFQEKASMDVAQVWLNLMVLLPQCGRSCRLLHAACWSVLELCNSIDRDWVAVCGAVV